MLKSSKHRQLVAGLPWDRLLTETDGPFVENDGRPVRPREVARTVENLAELRSLTIEEMAESIVSNLKALVTP